MRPGPKLDRRFACVSGLWWHLAKLCKWPAFYSNQAETAFAEKQEFAKKTRIMVPVNQFLRGCHLLNQLYGRDWYHDNDGFFWPRGKSLPGVLKNKSARRILLLSLSDDPRIKARKNRKNELKALFVELAFEHEQERETE